MKKKNVSRRFFLDSTGKAAAGLSCCILCRHAMAEQKGRNEEKASSGSKFKVSYYSACGMYCGGCPTLIKNEKMDKLEKVECLGCFGDKIHPSEANCEMRKCAIEKKIKACSLCKDYPCEKTKKHFATKIVWTVEAEKNLGIIKEKGLDKWLAAEKARWACTKCGTRVSFCDKKCPKCETKLKNLG